MFDALNQALYAGLVLDDLSKSALFWLAALAQWPAYALPPLILGFWVLGGSQDRRAVVLASIVACLALLVAGEASQWIDHPRPFMVGLAPNVLDHAAESSFPSDHATLFFALAISLTRAPPRSMPRLGVALALVGLVVGWARVVLGIHFPLDIAGAAAIGAISAALVFATPLRRIAEIVLAIGEAVHRRLLPSHLGQTKGDDARSAG